MKPIFNIQSVTKKFEDFTALNDVSLQLENGQVTALIGPSGCGKSTLIKTLLGLEAVTSGSIHFENQDILELDTQLYRQKIGYVIQSGGLFPHYTARENVTLMAKYLKWDDQRIQERLDGLLNLTNLAKEVLNRYPAELSGGQRQRLALMRALMLEPKVLFLDEPLGALDTIIRHGLQTELKQIFSSLNMTVILVTHDMAEAAYLADTLVLMSDGEIVQQGKLEDLVNKPASPFVTQFLTAQRHIDDMLENV